MAWPRQSTNRSGSLQLDGHLNFICLLDRGPLPYGEVLAMQEDLHGQRSRNMGTDTVLFLEHSPVISLGRRGESADILADATILAERGIETFRSDRGGQVTFHGPGQLVIYFIIRLGTKVRQVRQFVEGIEQACMEYLKERYGLDAHLEAELPGIWLAEGKVAAVGVSLKDRVSMHGIALNLSVDLSFFSTIVPCGIRRRPVLSVESTGKVPDSLEAAALDLMPRLAAKLGYESWSGW